MPRSGGESVEVTRALRLLLLTAVLLCGFAGFHLADHSGLTHSGTASPQPPPSSTAVTPLGDEVAHTTADGGSHGPTDEACLTLATLMTHQFGWSKHQTVVRQTTDLRAAVSPAAGPSPAQPRRCESVGLQLADLSVLRT
jgi:hypothetical protein